MLSVPPATITSAAPPRIRSAASAIDCNPEAQYRLIVIAEAVTGSPARKLATRATFIPCSASGIAQPRITSSTSDLSSCGTRHNAPLIANAARSSGRVVRSVPRGALPTAVRTADAMMTSFMGLLLISKRFTGLQRKGDALLRLLLAAQREECLTLKIKQILFAHQRARHNLAARKRIRNPVRHLGVVVGDVLPFAHRPDG